MIALRDDGQSVEPTVRAYSLDEAFVAFNDTLVRHATRQVRGNHEVGQDLTQDVWNSLSKPANRRALEALPHPLAQQRWLFHCLSNRLRDHFRQIAHCPAASAEPFSHIQAFSEHALDDALFTSHTLATPAARDASELVEAREQLRLVLRKVGAEAQHEPWQRDALELMLAGWHPKEITERLARRYPAKPPTYGSVKMFTHRARLRLDALRRDWRAS